MTVMEIGKADDTNDKKKGIIFLHGIMGSNLYAGSDIKDGEKVKYKKGEMLWIKNPMSGLMELDEIVKINNKVRMIACDKEGKSINDIVTEKLNDACIPEQENAKEYGANGIYTKIMKVLKKKFGDDNARFLSYDWRLGIEEAAKALSPCISQMAVEYDVLYMIAHSMGGLVACLYLKNSEYRDKIRLITLGTPFLGAPKTLYIIKTGKALPFNYGEEGLKDVCPNIRSTYELMPSSAYFDNGRNSYITIRNIQRELAEDGDFASYLDLSFDDKPLNEEETTELILNKETGFNMFLAEGAMDMQCQQDWLEFFNQSPYCCAIVGHGEKTPIEILKKKIENYYKGRYIKTTSEYTLEHNLKGDGTVPLISSSMNEKIDKSKIYYVHETHEGLVKDDNVIGLILAKINNWENPEGSQVGYNLCKIGKGSAKTKGIKYLSVPVMIDCTEGIEQVGIYNNHGDLIKEIIKDKKYTIHDRIVAAFGEASGIELYFAVNTNDYSEFYTVKIKSSGPARIKIKNKNVIVGPDEDYTNGYVKIKVDV